MPDMTLSELYLWADHTERSASAQMAVDEAAFEAALSDGITILRLYRWAVPAVTIGYFDKVSQEEPRPVIRRMTGGGLVEHGCDLTFCLTIPAEVPASQARTEARYHWIHESLYRALKAAGLNFDFVAENAGERGPCFSNPVKWDLVDAEGRKRVGGAQRKSRGAVIHQGSIQLGAGFENSGTFPDWAEEFARNLAREVTPLPDSKQQGVEAAAAGYDRDKYGLAEWNLDRKFKTRLL